MNEVVWLTIALVVVGILWLVGKRLSHLKENLKCLGAYCGYQGWQ